LPGDSRPLDTGPRPPGSGVLVIGYGNPLRGDDGLGMHAARLLADDPRLLGARVIERHQLTPELAADFSEAALVVLVDANVVDEAGAVSVRRLEAATGSGPGSSHHTDPADLAALARELWGASPAVFLVSVGAASLEMGETLSATIRRALPAVVEAVVAIVAEHGGSGRPA
jgi:hydrogenase maturation protease